ncbi:hypothetical protein D3C79_881250 [compost metagenome]
MPAMMHKGMSGLEQMFPATALINRTGLFHAGLQQLARLFGQWQFSQLMQLFQIAIQAVHLRRLEYLARMVQPGQQLFDARQLFCQVFRALSVKR